MLRACHGGLGDPPGSDIAPLPEPSAPRRPITYQPSLFTSRELPLVVQFETIASGSVQPSPRKPQTFGAAPARRKVFPASRLSSSLTSARARPIGQAGGRSHLLRCSGYNPRASRDGGRSGYQHYRHGAGCFRNHLPPGGWALHIECRDGAHVGSGGRRRDLLQSCGAWRTAVPSGRKWTRLRLVNFDGQTPTRAQRFYRTASGYLSLMAGGIGLLWGLVDEETPLARPCRRPSQHPSTNAAGAARNSRKTRNTRNTGGRAQRQGSTIADIDTTSIEASTNPLQRRGSDPARTPRPALAGHDDSAAGVIHLDGVIPGVLGGEGEQLLQHFHNVVVCVLRVVQQHDVVERRLPISRLRASSK